MTVTSSFTVKGPFSKNNPKSDEHPGPPCTIFQVKM